MSQTRLFMTSPSLLHSMAQLNTFFRERFPEFDSKFGAILRANVYNLQFLGITYIPGTVWHSVLLYRIQLSSAHLDLAQHSKMATSMGPEGSCYCDNTSVLHHSSTTLCGHRTSSSSSSSYKCHHPHPDLARRCSCVILPIFFFIIFSSSFTSVQAFPSHLPAAQNQQSEWKGIGLRVWKNTGH